MIWLYICIALAISLLLCRGKKIEYIHYIWLLFPIEMYGISIAGATVKPYMLFGLIIILDNLRKRREMKLSASVIIILAAIFLSDLLNGFVTASFMQHLMFALNVVIALAYLTACGNKPDTEAMGTAAMSALIGFGLVFIGTYFIRTAGFEWADITSSVRTDSGIFLRQANAGGVYSVRLRGFTIDPNSCMIPMIPGVCFAAGRLLRPEGGIGRSIFASMIFIALVPLTCSRMAYICTAALILVLLCCCKRKPIVLFICLLAACAVTLSALFIPDAFATAVNRVSDIFGTRASLTDENGRFTIWKENVQYILENNKLWLGVGQNQIQYYSASETACHNTWLEWVCGCGIFVGLYITAWFFAAPVGIIRKLRGDKELIRAWSPLIISYIGIMLIVLSVDNITNVSMLTIALLLYHAGSVRADSPEIERLQTTPHESEAAV